jgi:UPF0716 protein FxsA
MWKLVLLFTVVPALELYLLLRIGAWLGPLPTVALILGTGLLGGWMAKREGLSVLRGLMEGLRGGLPPAVALMEGALVVVGGLLLVTPGVLTDLAGFAFILGPTRRRLAPVALRWLARRFQVELSVGAPRAAPPAQPPAPSARHFDHPVPP